MTFERMIQSFGEPHWPEQHLRSPGDRARVAVTPRDVRDRLGGAVFAGGLYQVLPEEASVQLTESVLGAELEGLPDTFSAFGADWRGFLYGGDASGGVWSVEWAFCEAFSIPTSVAEFHDGLLVDLRAAALAEAQFREWEARSRRPLASLRCLGYQKPPFLGGSQGPDNIVDVDMSVYVTLTLQVFQRVRDLAPGTVVEPFRLG